MASEPKTASAAEEMLSVESRSVEMRLQRLEQLRAALPEQVTRAAGVAGMRLQLGSESKKLETMRTVSREVAVVCPAYGKIGQVRYKPGDVMTSGEVMVTSGGKLSTICIVRSTALSLSATPRASASL